MGRAGSRGIIYGIVIQKPGICSFFPCFPCNFQGKKGKIRRKRFRLPDFPKTLLRLFFASRGYLNFLGLFLETLQEYV